ncbi:hypothetical protein N8Z63_02895 [Octadecabacter sp.]|nr:hypothetical protein [Octadecabacter sp.]
MKNILLTTTALVAFAGAAAADGHTSFTWGGAATAGIARDGGESSSAVAAGTQSASGKTTSDAAIADTAGNAITTNDEYVTAVIAQVKADLATANTNLGTAGATAATLSGGTTATLLRADIVLLRAEANLANNGANAAAITAALDAATTAESMLDNATGTAAAAAVPAGDFDTYAEVSITATGSVTLDSGVTITAGVSVDAGTGYDFADDDGFDAPKTNGVGLDYVTIDGGAMGALTIDKNDIAHLVDGDDDGTGDIKYTNTFGALDFALVMDVASDTDVVAARAVASSIAWDTANDDTDYTAAVAAVDADVAWSTKLNYTVSDSMGVYVAIDEEGGNTIGGSYSMNGFTVSASSALEALQEELNESRSNTLTVGYVAGAVTVGASWNSIDDGNQWSMNAAYAADALSLAFSTNEAESWEITAGYELSDAASIVGGLNYTDDAYVGVTFDF